MHQTVICPNCQYVNVPMGDCRLTVCGRCGHRFKSAESARGKPVAALLVLLFMSAVAAFGIYWVRAEDKQETAPLNIVDPLSSNPSKPVVAPIITPIPTVPSPPTEPVSAEAEAPETPVAAPSKHARRPVPKKPAGDNASSPPVKAVGFLNLNSIPSSHVIVDGRPVGKTPLLHVETSAGAHAIVFIHPTLGRKAVSVTVVPGKTVNAVTRFE